MKKKIFDMKTPHKIWHQFSNFLEKAYGKDLIVKKKIPFTNEKGETKEIKYNFLNTAELSKKLVGIKVIERVTRYINLYCKDIKIVNCDDESYSGSILLLIPHPEHGITIIFIPQNTTIQNTFFLYPEHSNKLLKELKKMKLKYKI